MPIYLNDNDHDAGNAYRNEQKNPDWAATVAFVCLALLVLLLFYSWM